MAAGTEAPTREGIDAAHAANGTTPPPLTGQTDLDGGTVEASPAPIEELRIDGTTQLGMFDAGGKKPTGSSIRLTGGKVELIDGRAFRKGDVVKLEVVAIVREVAQRDKPDPKTGIVVDCQQKHLAEITDVRLLDALDD